MGEMVDLVIFLDLGGTFEDLGAFLFFDHTLINQD